MPEQLKNESIVALDTNKQQIPNHSLIKPNKPYITTEWDSIAKIYYYDFFDKKGKIIKRLTRITINENNELQHLPFQVIPSRNKEELGIKDYSLYGLKPNDKNKKSLIESGVIPQSVLSHTHQLKVWDVSTDLHGFIPDIPNGGYKFMTQKAMVWAIDSIDPKVLFSKTVVKVLNVQGKQIARVEENINAYQTSLSDNAQFLLLDNSEVILGDEWYSVRKPYLLIDLKNKKKYSIPIDFPDFASSHGISFTQGTYFNFYFTDQYKLHVLIDPYHRTIYSKQYRYDSKEFNNPDLSTYTQASF